MNQITIDYIQTNTLHRGNKIGMRLILKVARIYQKTVDMVHLDDTTDGVPPRNLYYKLGFQALNVDGYFEDWTMDTKLGDVDKRISIQKLINYKIT